MKPSCVCSIKRIYVSSLLLAVIICLGGCAHKDRYSPSSYDRSYSSASSSSNSTAENLKSITASKLSLKISSLISSGEISSKIDVGNTRYEITKMEENDGTYTVYGNGYFYDVYGKLCEATSKSTSSYSFTFYVTVDSNSRTDCVINYK